MHGTYDTSVAYPMVRSRSLAARAAHYAIERELADRLRSASREERSNLYMAIYEELYERVPDHPLCAMPEDAADRARRVETRLGLLRKYLTPETSFLEIGAGDAALSLAIAPMVRSVVAVDVCPLLPDDATPPSNFRLYVTRGTRLGVADGAVSLAYSNQLLEHFHPEDAVEHIRNVANALRPGGLYVCSTPNRLAGPHDISRDFDPIATGLHLKEYSGSELEEMFTDAGFSRFEWLIAVQGRYYRVALSVLRCLETLLIRLPDSLRRQIARRLPVRKVLNGIVVATR